MKKLLLISLLSTTFSCIAEEEVKFDVEIIVKEKSKPDVGLYVFRGEINPKCDLITHLMEQGKKEGKEKDALDNFPGNGDILSILLTRHLNISDNLCRIADLFMQKVFLYPAWLSLQHAHMRTRFLL